MITAINIIAGFLIGVFQQNVPFRQALTTYTILTVGDGLVTLMPSLLVSVAGGLVVTRASSEFTIGAEIQQQLTSQRRTLWIAAGVMLSLTLIPGLPKLSFLDLIDGEWRRCPADVDLMAHDLGERRGRAAGRNWLIGDAKHFLKSLNSRVGG